MGLKLQSFSGDTVILGKKRDVEFVSENNKLEIQGPVLVISDIGIVEAQELLALLAGVKPEHAKAAHVRDATDGLQSQVAALAANTGAGKPRQATKETPAPLAAVPAAATDPDSLSEEGADPEVPGPLPPSDAPDPVPDVLAKADKLSAVFRHLIFEMNLRSEKDLLAYLVKNKAQIPVLAKAENLEMKTRKAIEAYIPGATTAN